MRQSQFELHVNIFIVEVGKGSSNQLLVSERKILGTMSFLEVAKVLDAFDDLSESISSGTAEV